MLKRVYQFFYHCIYFIISTYFLKILTLNKSISMKEFVNDIQNLIVKHWGKLIVTTIIVTLLINYKDVSNGFMDGFRDSYYGKNKTQSK